MKSYIKSQYYEIKIFQNYRSGDKEIPMMYQEATVELISRLIV